jgi:hypothetical protein
MFYGIFVTLLFKPELGNRVSFFVSLIIGAIKMDSSRTSAVVCSRNDIKFEP